MKHEELRHLSAGPKGFDDLRRKSKNIHKIPNSWVLWLDCRIPFILLICQDSKVSLQEPSNTVSYYNHEYMLHGFTWFPVLPSRRQISCAFSKVPCCRIILMAVLGPLPTLQRSLENDASKCIKMLHQCTGFSGNVSFHVQILTYTLQGVTVVTATKNAEINELVHRNTQPWQMMEGTEMKDHVISLSQHSEQQS